MQKRYASLKSTGIHWPPLRSHTSSGIQILLVSFTYSARKVVGENFRVNLVYRRMSKREQNTLSAELFTPMLLEDLEDNCLQSGPRRNSLNCSLHTDYIKNELSRIQGELPAPGVCSAKHGSTEACTGRQAPDPEHCAGLRHRSAAAAASQSRHVHAWQPSAGWYFRPAVARRRLR